jgi:8-hydroxy-5-deazaflavin:NADPH oxidoreductase
VPLTHDREKEFRMKIGVIGSGKIGGTAARLFAHVGHDVALSNSRGPESLRDLVSEIGPRARAMTVEDAARFGDVVLLAVPFRNAEALPPPETVRGKVVIDAMNAYAAGGGSIDLGDSTSSEETARRLPEARIVKAFNTIYYEHLAKQGDPGKPLDQRRAIPIAGDDSAAIAIVSTLIEDIGFAPVETGGLHDGGRRQQPGTPVYNVDLTAAEARAVLDEDSSKGTT